MEASKKRKSESDAPDPPEGKKPKNTVGDTAAHTYQSIFNTIEVCNDNKKAIEERCKPENYELKKRNAFVVLNYESVFISNIL